MCSNYYSTTTVVCASHVYNLVAGCCVSSFLILCWHANSAHVVLFTTKQKEIKLLFLFNFRVSRFVSSRGTVLTRLSCSLLHLYWTNACSPCLVSAFFASVLLFRSKWTIINSSCSSVHIVCVCHPRAVTFFVSLFLHDSSS